MSDTTPIYGSLEHMNAVTNERQEAWSELVEACRTMGIEVNNYSTNETLAWRIFAHLLRTAPAS